MSDRKTSPDGKATLGQIVCVTTVMMIAISAGDPLFPELTESMGAVASGALRGTVGAALGALAYEFFSRLWRHSGGDLTR